ncbi:MAG: hypothetical protein WBF87_02230 [Mesorhizobium sp.]
MTDNGPIRHPASTLSQAIRDVKNAAADRDDVVVELREASRTRLELLAQELADVAADVPEDDQQFDFAISSGLQPRLWIDATAHVAMGRDKRVYRFVRDTRLGRVVLAESTDIKPVADQVTRYVAERIIERQRMMDGYTEPMPKPADPVETLKVAAAVANDPKTGWGAFFGGMTLVLIGAAAGAAAVLGWLWESFPPGTFTP